MTDYRKIFLYVALAFVGLALFQAWQKDHPPVNVPTQQQQTNKSVQANSTGTTGNSNTSAIPTENNKAVNNAPAQTKNYIHVETDVLALDIDPVGGTVVKAQLLKYPESIKSKTPFVLLNNKAEDTYLVESGLVSNGKVVPAIHYHSKQSSYTLADNAKQLEIQLIGNTDQGVQVEKTYTLLRDSYQMRVNIHIANTHHNKWQGQLYTQIERGLPPKQKHGFLHSITTFLGAAYGTPDEHYNKLKFDDMADKPLNKEVRDGWIAMIQQYFLSAWVPENGQAFRYYSGKNSNGLYSVGMLSPKINLNKAESSSFNYKLYIGPAVVDRLKAVAPYLYLTVDYGWLWFIGIGLLWLMQKFNMVVGNWGLAIVLVTVVIKAAFYWFSASSYRSMAKMKGLQPQLTALKERHADDKQQFSKAMMELYKKEKVNPLGGCLPMVIQLPVFFALYWVLLESVELRQAPFILWIKDLSAADPYFVLPVLMGISMFIQQKLSPPASADPTQAKVFMMLPIVFTVFFLNMPAGLVLYWLVNNILTILQQWHILRKVEKEQANKTKSRKKAVKKTKS